MRIAVLDLGTNVFNLLLASFTQERCKHLKEFKCAARLGAGGLASGMISPEAFETAKTAMSQIMEQIQQEGGADLILPYATSAVRDAKNGPDFVKYLHEQFGVDVQVIPGEREAELIFKGIIQSLPQELCSGRENMLMLDIGGGSNEFIISNGKKVFWKQSFPIGMARMRERFSYPEPIRAEVIDQFNAFCNDVLSPLWQQIEWYKPTVFVGSSGSFDTFKDLIFGCPLKEESSVELPIDRLLQLHQRLLASTAEQRLTMPGMSPIRVDYIVLASVFTQLVLSRMNPRIVYRSAYSLKEGAMAELYDRWQKHIL